MEYSPIRNNTVILNEKFLSYQCATPKFCNFTIGILHFKKPHGNLVKNRVSYSESLLNKIR